MQAINSRSRSPFVPFFRPRTGHWRARLLIAVVGVMAVPAVTRASIAGFGDFSQFTINKNDTGAVPTFPAPGLIQLINGASEARSIFANTPQGVSNFTASFNYQVISPGANEGAAFVLQNDSRGAAAVGTGNHALSGVGTSVDITLNIGNNNTGLFTNGNADGGGLNVTPVSFASGHPINVQFVYSGSTLTEHLLDTVTLANFTTADTVSIPTIVGGSTAFVGITAGSSTNSVDQLFSDFQFTSSVPEPCALALVAGCAVWSLIRRRASSR
jgi:hypothetical protein